MLDTNSKYKLVLGLEIHLHPKTASKMFCTCSADIYGKEANTHTCPVCLGLPGALPVPNEDAVRKTQLLGLALGCHLNNDSRFDRKHYIYPDLPKGYQISQYKLPLCEGGYLEVFAGDDAGNSKKIELERIHLEEDTAKSFHEGGKTLVDFNKSGMPLIEIVTKPVFRSSEEAVDFAERIQHLVRYLGLSDADMEKGQLRIEPNISVRTQEMEDKNELPKYKVEVKNINSFRFLAKAIESEIERQSKALEAGEILLQENRGFDEKTGKTLPQRAKEDAHDYRYFPEPDIPPMHFDGNYFEELQSKLPHLPWELKNTLISEYKLTSAQAEMLVYKLDKSLTVKFLDLVEKGLESNKVANLLINNLEYQSLAVEQFIEKLKSTEQKITDETELTRLLQEILKNNPQAIEDYKKGKKSSAQFILGVLMRETKGQVDAQISMGIITKLLEN